jgi:hypothetical protein
VKVHRIKTYAFICDEFCRKGANLICEILRVVVCDLASTNKLPVVRPVFYFHADNCGENINKILLAFLTNLVCRKVFAKVKAVFNGGTHPR